MPRTTAAVFLAVLLVAGTSHTAMAEWKDSGFKNDSSNWNVSTHPLSVIPVRYRDSAGNVCFPVDGNCFGLLVAGRPDIPVFIYKSVHLTAGQALSAMATFEAFDSVRINDWASVRIYNVQTEAEDDDDRYPVENFGLSENSIQADVDAVPVPPSLLLLGAGLLAVFYIRRRSRSMRS